MSEESERWFAFARKDLLMAELAMAVPSPRTLTDLT